MNFVFPPAATEELVQESVPAPHHLIRGPVLNYPASLHHSNRVSKGQRILEGVGHGYTGDIGVPDIGAEC